tara:strand:- start:756 stop:1166 length:411 start_codon:yes stop_codon:yes gene_type:complete
MKNPRLIALGAAGLAGLLGVVPTLGIWFSESTVLINSAIIITLVLIIAATLLALASSVNGLLINPKGPRSAAFGLGGLLLIFITSYVFADGSDYLFYTDVDESTTKWVAAGLNAFYITFSLAIGAVIYSSLSRIRK